MEFVGFFKKNIYLQSIFEPCHTTMNRLNTLLERFTDDFGKKIGSKLQLSSKIWIIVYRKKPVPLFARIQRTHIVKTPCLINVIQYP